MKIHTEKYPNRQRNRPLKDYCGQRFGRLTAQWLLERRDKGDHIWYFLCDCGGMIHLNIKSARSGHTQSCGCIKREETVERNTTHGLSKTRAYKVWKDMRSRCNNPKNAEYDNYGGRGIMVCDRWGNFEGFYGDMGDRPEGMTIDRIEPNGNYEPTNCRWATAIQQANNRRGTIWHTRNGETKPLSEWCVLLGVDHSKARYRKRHGLDPFSATDFRK